MGIVAGRHAVPCRVLLRPRRFYRERADEPLFSAESTHAHVQLCREDGVGGFLRHQRARLQQRHELRLAAFARVYTSAQVIGNVALVGTMAGNVHGVHAAGGVGIGDVGVDGDRVRCVFVFELIAQEAFLQHGAHRNLESLRVKGIGREDGDVFLPIAQHKRVAIGVLRVVEALGKYETGVFLRVGRAERENVLHAVAGKTDFHVHARAQLAVRHAGMQRLGKTRVRRGFRRVCGRFHRKHRAGNSGRFAVIAQRKVYAVPAKGDDRFALILAGNGRRKGIGRAAHDVGASVERKAVVDVYKPAAGKIVHGLGVINGLTPTVSHVEYLPVRATQGRKLNAFRTRGKILACGNVLVNRRTVDGLIQAVEFFLLPQDVIDVIFHCFSPF